MPKHLLIIIFFSSVLLGCTGVQPIENLGLPPVSVIEGVVSDLTPTGFRLTDESGSIEAQVEPMPSKILDGERVKLYGNLVTGKTRRFDTYVIENNEGKRFILTPPSPHLGIVIQSSFE